MKIPPIPSVGCGDLFGELEYIAASPAQEHGGFHPRVVAAAGGAMAEITRLREEREWLQFVVNFVRLPLGIAPDVSNFDREKILAALDAALSSPNSRNQPRDE